jgi:hypothetical protein
VVKPIMFVASSTEDKELIDGLSVNLKGKVWVRNWANMPWPLSEDTPNGIESFLDEADFAAFILNANDVATIRGREEHIPRDNVLFELGFSFGLLKRKRTFILTPEGSEVRTLSDLYGITTVQFEDDGDAQQAMDVPAIELWRAIEKVGIKPRPSERDPLERGDTAEIDRVADSALYVVDSRYTSVDELKRTVLKGERVPAKFQFAQPDGGRYWLQLCRGDNYPFFERAKAHLGENRSLLSEKVREAAETTAVDLISLGCGDGAKDDMLLRSLAADLEETEELYYYPIDISDILLVEAIRKISRNGLNRSRFRCKAILGDFTDLSSLSRITDYRPNTNLFSVLGNTLGSFDESDIINSIGGAMQPGDLVLIEANIGKPADSVALLKDEAAAQWDLSTLDALGIPRDSCDLKQDEKVGLSMVPGTRTLVSSAVPRDDDKSRYMLSAMHHYDFEIMKDCLADELKVAVIAAIPSKHGVGLLLGQRQS